MKEYKDLFEALIVDGIDEVTARLEIIKAVQADFDYLSTDQVEANIIDVLDYLGI